MRKLILLLSSLVLAGGMNGQTSGSNVVNVNIANALTLPTPGNNVGAGGANLQNIGQDAHTLLLTISSCTSASYTISMNLFGSGDGINYINLGPSITSQVVTGAGTTVITRTLTGYGSYPFVKATVFINNTGSCGIGTYTVNYFGNSSPSTVLADSLNATTLMQFYASNTITAGTTATLITPANGATTIVVYGYTIDLPSTITSVDFDCNFSASTVHFQYMVNSTASTRIYPSGNRPIWACQSQGAALRITTVGTGTLAVNIVYRAE